MNTQFENGSVVMIPEKYRAGQFSLKTVVGNDSDNHYVIDAYDAGFFCQIEVIANEQMKEAKPVDIEKLTDQLLGTTRTCKEEGFDQEYCINLAEQFSGVHPKKLQLQHELNEGARRMAHDLLLLHSNRSAQLEAIEHNCFDQRIESISRFYTRG